MGTFDRRLMSLNQVAMEMVGVRMALKRHEAHLHDEESFSKLATVPLELA
jgi:hypothetical protein